MTFIKTSHLQKRPVWFEANQRNGEQYSPTIFELDHNPTCNRIPKWINSFLYRQGGRVHREQKITKCIRTLCPNFMLWNANLLRIYSQTSYSGWFVKSQQNRKWEGKLDHCFLRSFARWWMDVISSPWSSINIIPVRNYIQIQADKWTFPMIVTGHRSCAWKPILCIFFQY